MSIRANGRNQAFCSVKSNGVTMSDSKGKMDACYADLDNSRNRYWGSSLAVVGTRQAFILALIRWVSGRISLVTNKINTLLILSLTDQLLKCTLAH